MNLKRLLVISANRLLGNPTFPVWEWRNFSRKAYVEPIVVRDGYHDYVLMGAPDYDEMQTSHALLDGLHRQDREEAERFIAHLRAERAQPPIGSPDIAIVAAALAEMAKISTPAATPAVKPTVYKMRCPQCSGTGNAGFFTEGASGKCRRCHGSCEVETTCLCDSVGKIVCSVGERC